jgi:tryptophan synthase alpha chain
VKRIAAKFLELKKKKQCAFVTYICAGDPDYKTSLEILKALPKAGADIIELGVPFLDPAGDGPIIENAFRRSVANGMNLKKTLKMAHEFRKNDKKTPLILMGYYNPILKYGLSEFFADACKSGIDGILTVDLPLEEQDEVLAELLHYGLDLIRLIAPTTNWDRARKIAANAGGFLYLISMLGITGTKLAKAAQNKTKLQDLRQASALPIVIGFGIKTPKQAAEFCTIGADGLVVGSAIVAEIARHFSAQKTSAQITAAAIKKVEEFSKIIKETSNKTSNTNSHLIPF